MKLITGRSLAANIPDPHLADRYGWAVAPFEPRLKKFSKLKLPLLCVRVGPPNMITSGSQIILLVCSDVKLNLFTYALDLLLEKSNFSYFFYKQSHKSLMVLYQVIDATLNNYQR